MAPYLDPDYLRLKALQFRRLARQYAVPFSAKLLDAADALEAAAIVLQGRGHTLH